MEKKAFPAVVGIVVAFLSLCGVVACGVVCFNLDQASKAVRAETAAARAQLSVLSEALKVQESDLKAIRQQLESATNKLAAVQEQSQEQSERLNQRLAGLSKLAENRQVAQMNFQPLQVQFQAPEPEVAAADSVEGKLRSEGKAWERGQGEIVPGAYVEDTLQGRMNQPRGRGHIGKILSLGLNDSGAPCATVDFGRGLVDGIMLSELAPIHFVAPEAR